MEEPAEPRRSALPRDHQQAAVEALLALSAPAANALHHLPGQPGRRPQGQQDRIGYSYTRDALLMVVADGMGGHLHGEVAAQIAVTEITRRFQHEARNQARRSLRVPRLRPSSRAHRAISRTPVEQQPARVPAHHVRGLRGAGRLRLLGARRRLAPVPAARGAARRATRDHSQVQQLIDAGRIRRGGRDAPGPQQDLQLPRRRGPAAGRRRPRDAARDRRHDRCCAPTASGRRSPRSILGSMLAQADGRSALLPGLLIEAQRRAPGESRQHLGGRDDLGEPGRPARGRHRETSTTSEFATSTNTTEHLDTPGARSERRDRRRHRARDRRDPERDQEGPPQNDR